MPKDRLTEITARLALALAEVPAERWTDYEGYVNSDLLAYEHTAGMICALPAELAWLVAEVGRLRTLLLHQLCDCEEREPATLDPDEHGADCCYREALLGPYQEEDDAP